MFEPSCGGVVIDGDVAVTFQRIIVRELTFCTNDGILPAHADPTHNGATFLLRERAIEVLPLVFVMRHFVHMPF